jgi:hypothetical protein
VTPDPKIIHEQDKKNTLHLHKNYVQKFVRRERLRAERNGRRIISNGGFGERKIDN